MMMTPPRKRTRGRPRRLSVDAIVEAAVSDGLAEFSMPSVAARLGVAHSGLYRYVDSHQDLVVRALDHIARAAPWPPAEQPWRQLLEQIGETLWALCAQYPGYDITALRTRNVSPGFVEMLSLYVDSLMRQGLGVVDATAAIEFVRALVLTSSIEANRLRAVADHADAPDHTIPGFDDPEKWAGRGWYGRHLDTWLDGLDQRIGAVHVLRAANPVNH